MLGAWYSRTRDGVENEDQLVDGLPCIREALGLISTTMQTRCGGTFHNPQWVGAGIPEFQFHSYLKCNLDLRYDYLRPCL